MHWSLESMCGASLIPQPQAVETAGRPFAIDRSVTVVVEPAATKTDRFAATDLVAPLAAKGIAAHVTDVRSSIGPWIVLGREPHRLDSHYGDQGYRLVADGAALTIEANGETGLFYGTRTCLQLLHDGGDTAVVRGVRIDDWPAIPYRAVHYDTKHHQDRAAYVRYLIRRLADWKINLLIWEWEDKFAYRSHPEIGAPGAFTLAEMQAFTRYARQYHIQLVPLVQGLGHASYILKWPQHVPLREIPASNWEFCPLKAGTYRLLLDLCREALEATPGSEFLHIGSDETYELGLGKACGCRARAATDGKRGLLLHFLQRSADALAPYGRRLIAWGGEYRPGAALQPPSGLIVAEFDADVEVALRSRDAGYPAWVYDPNPGIEHLFLLYFRRWRGGELVESCLAASQRRLAQAAEGMVNTSWDDSGLHNQIWMLSFANSAGWSWSPAVPPLDVFVDRFFGDMYGPQPQDLSELWGLLNDGACFYMDSFERKVWHWGDVGKTHLPDLPRGDALEIDPYWRREYEAMIARSQDARGHMARAVEICADNLQRRGRNAYDMRVLRSIARLIDHTAVTYLMLVKVEQAFVGAHQQRFVSYSAAHAGLVEAARLVERHLKVRATVFAELVAVWEETRLPKGLQMPDKPYFHQQDRARHFANRRADMSYLICDEQLLDLEGYLARLTAYAAWYRRTYCVAAAP